jgi:hypothetical protein
MNARRLGLRWGRTMRWCSHTERSALLKDSSSRKLSQKPQSTNRAIHASFARGFPQSAHNYLYRTVLIAVTTYPRNLEMIVIDN